MSIFNIFKSKPKETESKPEVARDTTWDGAQEKYTLLLHEKIKEVNDKLELALKSINKWHVVEGATVKPKREPVHWNREAAANLSGYYDFEDLGLLPEQNLVKFLLKHNLIDEDVKDDVERAAKWVIYSWHKDPWSKQKIAALLKAPSITLKGKDGTKHKIEDEIRIILNMTEKPFMTEKQAIDLSSKGYIPMTVIKEHFCLVEG